MEVGSVTIPVTIEVDVNSLVAPAELTRFDYAGRAALFEGVAARTQSPGDPLRYDTGPEYRDVDGLKQLVAQLPGKPLTLYHPDGLLREGAPGKIIGKVMSARVDGDRAVVTIQVTHPDGVAAIEDGTKELSVGYSCSLDDSRFQRNIKVDHLAVVPRARCGPTCRIDGNDAQHDHSDGADCGCGCGGTCNLRAITYPADHMDPVTEPNLDKDLTAKARHDLPAKHFAVPGREALPIEDEGHVRAAMARFNQTDFQSPTERRAAFHRIVARAHELGIDTKSFEKEFGARSDDDQENKMDEETKKQLETLKAEVEAQKTRADQAQAQVDALTLERDIAVKDVKAEKTRADQATEALQAEKTRADQAEEAAKTAGEKARADAAEASKAILDAAVAERVELITKAAGIVKDEKGQPVDVSKLDNKDIKIAVIKHIDGDDIKADASDDYINGMFASALKRHATVAGSVNGARQALNQMRSDGTPAAIKTGRDAERAAQAEMTNRARTAWSKQNQS